MADETTKKPDAPIEDEELEELEDALSRGDVEVMPAPEPDLARTFTPENVEKFILGDITWGQLTGMTVKDAYAIAQIGYGFYEEARYHDARTIFEGLLVCNPYDAYFHTMLGAVYQQLDMEDEALYAYGMAVELDPESLHALVNRGELLLRRGEFGEALKDLKAAIDLDPEGNEAAGRRARVLAIATADVMKDIEKLAAQGSEQAKNEEKGP